ncbi:TetR/AcrR family transcriptional regulator [Rhodococcus sp. IEGM 1379]|uniref:TetR/AcrR family transcriptional regulator n=1 Tax=Rhodococcus sp. IEGM 1379 TaxID=3047086 RepID=UPI0024B644B2|nr:TetR/AcrR family transcriptional regulator [Rhodococcus sp. IEGM 1379]MDI9917724.1 TetR/AcrR family transcriptional regulator [Rhodococcus sp. IEGM 1379]
MLDNDSRISALPLAPPALHRDPPSTQRGARTRAALVVAARDVFERAGYLDARLTDIAKEAGCATGSFYTYFANKEEVFAAVLEVAREEMMHPGIGRVAGTDDPYAVLEASNRAYLAAYQRNAKLMGLMEQVAHIDPEFRRIRNERADAFIRRNARGIADLQKRGIVDVSLDPMTASIALSGMVSRFAYNVFTLGEGLMDGRPIDFEDLVVTVTKLWANGLKFPERG